MADIASAQNWDSLLAEANLAHKTQKLEVALSLGQQALIRARQDNGEVDSSVALVLHRLGVFHHTEPFDSALVYYKRAMEVWQRLEPRDPLNEAKTLNNLGSIYNAQGKYDLALDNYTRALELKEPHLGENDNSLARAFRNLGDLLSNLGRYIEAEEYLMRALKIRRNILPPDHPDIASTENDLGVLFQHRNQYDKAEYWYSRAVTTGAMRNGLAPPGFTNNLAVVWLERGKYAQAESLYISILRDTTIRDEFAGLKRALVWNNLGLTHQMMGRHEEAVIEFDSALEITRAFLSIEHPEYARRLCNKGKSLGELGLFAEAESLLVKSLELRERYGNEFRDDICHSLSALGWFYRNMGRHKESFEYYHREQQIYRRLVHWFVPHMTQHDALTYAENLQRSSDHCLSALRKMTGVDRGWIDSMTVALIYDVKGVVSEELASRRIQLSDISDPARTKIVCQYSEVQGRMFSMLAELPSWTADERHQFDSLAILAQELETRTLADNRSIAYHSVDPVNATAIASRLPGRSALVEYYVYADVASAGGSSGRQYLAIVTRSDGKPDVHDLGPGVCADSLIAKYRHHFRAIDSAGILPGQSQIIAFDRIAAGLYDYFVAPLAEGLGGIERLFLAPDGGANLISFASLKDTDGHYLLENWPIHYLHSGRDFIRDGKLCASGVGLIAIGDPEYDYDKSSLETGLAPHLNSDFVPAFALRGEGLPLQDGSLPSLPGTRQEIEAVVRCWERVTREPVVLMLGKDATESDFRKNLPGGRVVYIATHGFLREGSLAARLPYLHSGLYLAGANQSAHNIRRDPNDDGVVTAQDILLMNLRGVDLVVLSACESGLGEITDGEGVFGLRRSFQLAGARSVVSSLWHVPDQITAELMSPLFERSEADLMIRLRNLQLAQLNRLRHDGLADHPFSWAAFIASGACR